MVKQSQLMDEAREMLDEAREMLDDAVELLHGTKASLIDAPKDVRQEFDEQVRELRREAAAMRNVSKPSPLNAPAPTEITPEVPIIKTPEPLQWKKTDPLKLLRVDVTGRDNFKTMLKAAFKVLLAGKATFVFKKPVQML
jgi:hypothetical protein